MTVPAVRRNGAAGVALGKDDAPADEKTSAPRRPFVAKLRRVVQMPHILIFTAGGLAGAVVLLCLIAIMGR